MHDTMNANATTPVRLHETYAVETVTARHRLEDAFLGMVEGM
jgi:hypothetical protein